LKEAVDHGCSICLALWESLDPGLKALCESLGDTQDPRYAWSGFGFRFDFDQWPGIYFISADVFVGHKFTLALEPISGEKFPPSRS
jgi:hypothetical protein